MGIDIRWEDEAGNQLEEISDLKEHFGLTLELLPLEETICLRLIDPYGDTIFNQQQILVFISELQTLLQLITPNEGTSLQKKIKAKLETHNLSPDVIENRVKRLSSNETFEHLSKILDLAQRSKGKAHTYLKFYGD